MNCVLYWGPQNYGNQYIIIHKWHEHNNIVPCGDDLNIVLEL